LATGGIYDQPLSRLAHVLNCPHGEIKLKQFHFVVRFTRSTISADKFKSWAREGRRRYRRNEPVLGSWFDFVFKYGAYGLCRERRWYYARTHHQDDDSSLLVDRSPSTGWPIKSKPLPNDKKSY